jgi:hypothetical protein
MNLPDLKRAESTARAARESKPCGPYCTDCGALLPAEFGRDGRMVRADAVCADAGRECE